MKDFKLSTKIVLSLSEDCYHPGNEKVVHRLVGVHDQNTGSVKINNFYIPEYIFKFLKTYEYWNQFVKSFIENSNETILYDCNFPVEKDTALPCIIMKCCVD